jgi:hypothetical protein
MEIAVELRVNGGPAVARIGDTGRPIDPTQVAPPALATSLAEVQFWRHPFDAQLWRGVMDVETAAIGTLQFVEPQVVLRQRG